MPIRTGHGRAGAYRALWAWPLYSPRRLLGTAVAALVVLIAVAVVLGLLDGRRAQNAAASAVAAGSSTAASAAGAVGQNGAPVVAGPQATALTPGATPDAAVQTARAWVAAWVRPPVGVSARAWRDKLAPLTTAEFGGLLATVDPQVVPATKVTGAATPVAATASSAQITVPTDAGVVTVTVVDTAAGWRVSDAQTQRTGQ